MFASVIVPVYNSVRYICECLDSIAAQTFDDFEVVMVNDGSTDETPRICEGYARADARFRLVTRPQNGGASAARNTGIEHARGDYLLFLDNDDFWESTDALERIHALALEHEGPDLIAYPMGELRAGSGELFMPRSDLAARVNALTTFRAVMEVLLRHNDYYSQAGGKAVRRDLVVRHRLRFDETLRNNEDSDWSLRLLYHARSIKWMDESFYVWRRRSEVSQSSKPITYETVESMARIVDGHVGRFDSLGLDDSRQWVTNSFVAYIYVLMISYLFLDDSEDFVRLRQEQRSNAWLLSFAAQDRVKMVRASCRILGYNLTGRLLATVMRREMRAVDGR